MEGQMQKENEDQSGKRSLVPIDTCPCADWQGEVFPLFCIKKFPDVPYIVLQISRRRFVQKEFETEVN